MTETGKLPKNWRCFLVDDSNETEFFSFLPDQIAAMHTENKVTVTKGENVLSNQVIKLKENLDSCFHEEADTFFFVLEKYATMEGYRDVMFKAYDTDAVVVTISAMHHLQEISMQKIWVPFGQEAYMRWLPIHDISRDRERHTPCVILSLIFNIKSPPVLPPQPNYSSEMWFP